MLGEKDKYRVKTISAAAGIRYLEIKAMPT